MNVAGLVILLFECVVGKCFVVFYVFSFPAGVYVGTLNLIASIPGLTVSVLAIQICLKPQIVFSLCRILDNVFLQDLKM